MSWVFFEGLMLKLKLQYFGHLIRRADSFDLQSWKGLRGRPANPASDCCQMRDLRPGGRLQSSVTEARSILLPFLERLREREYEKAALNLLRYQAGKKI